MRASLGSTRTSISGTSRWSNNLGVAIAWTAFRTRKSSCTLIATKHQMEASAGLIYGGPLQCSIGNVGSWDRTGL